MTDSINTKKPSGIPPGRSSINRSSYHEAIGINSRSSVKSSWHNKSGRHRGDSRACQSSKSYENAFVAALGNFDYEGNPKAAPAIVARGLAVIAAAAIDTSKMQTPHVQS